MSTHLTLQRTLNVEAWGCMKLNIMQTEMLESLELFLLPSTKRVIVSFFGLEGGVLMFRQFERGFTLLEVVYSILILSLFTTTFFPILTMVYDERITIREQQASLGILSDSIHGWLYENDEPPLYESVKHNGTTYQLHHVPLKEVTSFCISWDGKNNRSYERCEQAKK